MTAVVPIEPGQWVLAYRREFWPGVLDGDMAAALERLAYRGSHWDYLRWPSDQFDVNSVDRVMPKTFIASDGQRHSRDLVVASASTEGEVVALRDKLFGIGFAADHAIEGETARRMATFEASVRADALAKVHAALPHIFGKGQPSYGNATGQERAR